MTAPHPALLALPAWKIVESAPQFTAGHKLAFCQDFLLLILRQSAVENHRHSGRSTARALRRRRPEEPFTALIFPAHRLTRTESLPRAAGRSSTDREPRSAS